ncbi:PAS domain S-box-containing protein [Cyclonatronum proteinivorum]|uniref:histidine kinase n=1 Tax=Cyclonatronum proteinivorum TaxID=1457365 RepID=A0A345UKZ2_9BACT|nr:PAS domain S-box protein [Cyclonatronum proteinivorum]AXJ01144.1 PAS domain S-box-containing protein [Cyclonatronum proteinivorum]
MSDRTPTAYDALPMAYGRFFIRNAGSDVLLTQSYNKAFEKLFGLDESSITKNQSLESLSARRNIDLGPLVAFIRRNPERDISEQLTLHFKAEEGTIINTCTLHAWIDTENFLHVFFQDEISRLLQLFEEPPKEVPVSPKNHAEHQHYDAPAENQPCSYIYAAPFGTFVTDEKGRYLDVNPAACELTGYTAEELLQMRITDVISTANADEALAFHRQLTQTGKLTGEFLLLRKNGSSIWCQLSAVKLSEDRFLGFQSDISRQKQAETELKRERRILAEIVDGTKAGTWRWNLETGDSMVNDRWGSILGYESGEITHLTLDGWLAFLHPEDTERTMKSLDKVIQGELDIYECEVRMKHKLGHWIWIYDRGSVTEFSPDGNPLMISGIQLDITARKEAKQKLEKSERRFRILFDNHTAVKLIIDPDTGQIVDANKAASAYYGWSHEALTNMRINDINTLSDKDIKSQLNNAATHLESNYQFKHRKADGSIRDVEVYSSIIQLEDKKLIHSIIHDNTARFEAELKLKREQKFNAALLESAQDGIVACDEKGNLKLFNKVARSWHQSDPDNSASAGWSNSYGLFDGEGKKQLTEQDIPLVRAFRGERFISVPITIKTKGLPTRLVAASGSPFTDEHGKKLGAVVIMRDVTEQRQLESQVSLQLAALKSAANAIAITDRDGNLEWINPAWEKLTGYAEQEVLSQNPRILKSGQQKKEYYTLLWETILAGKTWKGEIVNRRKDGSLYNEYQTITPLKNKEGKITHFIAIKEDITAQKEFEKKLLAQNETLKRIAWHQSHVVRRPVANIMGLIDLIEEEKNITENQLSAIEYLKEEILKLDEIVRKIVREANHITSGKFDIDVKKNHD